MRQIQIKLTTVGKEKVQDALLQKEKQRDGQRAFWFIISNLSTFVFQENVRILYNVCISRDTPLRVSFTTGKMRPN